MATVKPKSKVAAVLEQPKAGRALGMWISAALSLVCAVITLPFLSWIKLVRISELLQSLRIDIADIRLFSSYSYFMYLWDFVTASKAGILGFPAFILIVLAVAAFIMNLIFISIVLINKVGKRGHLQFYLYGKVAAILSMLAGLYCVWYCFGWANAKTYPGSFAPTVIVYILIVLALVFYIVQKILEAEERKIYHEHGLLVEIKRNWVLFIFLIPCFVYFMINNYLPMSGIYFAFVRFNFKDGLFFSPFVKMDNFRFLIKADLWGLTYKTILYNVVFIGLGNVLQIFFAILVSQCGVKWFKKTSQTLIFMPHFVSFVIVKIFVFALLEYQTGMITNMVLNATGNRPDFYNKASYWPFIIVLVNIWKGVGYGMVVYLATIMGISDEYYEAAKIDGANIYQQIQYITLPLLKPTFVILLIYAIGGIMRGQFELFYQLVGSNAVLYPTTDILDTYIYRITVSQPTSMAYGTAAGLYQSVFGLAIVLITNAIIKKADESLALF